MGGNLSKVLGGSGGGSDILSFLGMGPSATMSDFAVCILKSRTVSDSILEKFGPQLFKNFEKRKKVQLREELKSIVKIELSKEKTVLITVTAKDAKLAADVANQYVEEFDKFSQSSILSYTKKKLNFTKERKEATKKSLEALESKLRKYQETHAVVDVPEEVKAMIKYFADTKTLAISAEAQSTESAKMVESLKDRLGRQTAQSKDKLSYPVLDNDPKMVTYYTELTRLQMDLANKKLTMSSEHPEVKKISANISDTEGIIRKHISERLENIKSSLTPELIEAESTAFSYRAKQKALENVLTEMEKKMGKMPELGMEYGRLYRDVKTYTQIYTYWEMELQKALAEESKDPTDFQVLDAAIPPDHKYRPVMRLNLAIAILLGGLFGLIAVFGAEVYEKQKAEYEIRERTGVEKVG
jgi:uncharacterized protein involved in exopolysaccharide biosynthesis